MITRGAGGEQMVRIWGLDAARYTMRSMNPRGESRECAPSGRDQWTGGVHQSRRCTPWTTGRAPAVHERAVVRSGLRARRWELGRERLRWRREHDHRDHALGRAGCSGARAGEGRDERGEAWPHRLAHGPAHPLITRYLPRRGGMRGGDRPVLGGRGARHCHGTGHGVHHGALHGGPGHAARDAAACQQELTGEEGRHEDGHEARCPPVMHDPLMIPCAGMQGQCAVSSCWRLAGAVARVRRCRNRPLDRIVR